MAAWTPPGGRGRNPRAHDRLGQRGCPRVLARLTVLAVSVAIGAALLIGCGGNSGSSSTSSTASSSTPAAIKSRLEKAGYDVAPNDAGGNPPPIASFFIPASGGVRVVIYLYQTAQQASKLYTGIKGELATHPSRGVARLVGAHVYFAGKEHKLTPTERATFEKIVAVAEGKR